MATGPRAVGAGQAAAGGGPILVASNAASGTWPLCRLATPSQFTGQPINKTQPRWPVRIPRKLGRLTGHADLGGSGTVAGMCGRYASTRSAADLAALFEASDETEDGLVPDYNIAPTDPAPIIRTSARAGGRVLTAARWGLVPAWARDASGAARMINARAETVADSRAFGRSFAQRRCLVPADGWYEWRAGSPSPEERGRGRTASVGRRPGGAGKQPYFMTRPEGIVFGGIWSSWAIDGRNPMFTFSVLTLPADGDLALVHDRMPLVLEPSRWAAWLAGSDAGMLRAASPEYRAGIEIRPVSPAVGDVRNDGPDLIRAVAAQPLLASTVEQAETLFEGFGWVPANNFDLFTADLLYPASEVR
jgi:putative SOS response-associated peptidase YedK